MCSQKGVRFRPERDAVDGLSERDRRQGVPAMNDVSPISETEAEARAHGICFKTGPPRRVGVELEWLVHDDSAPLRSVGRAACVPPSLTCANSRSAPRSPWNPAASWSSARRPPTPSWTASTPSPPTWPRYGTAPRPRPHPRRIRPRPLEPPPPAAAPAALPGHGGVLRPDGPGGRSMMCSHRLRAGLPGRGYEGGGPRRLPGPLAAGPPARPGAGRRVRQLAVRRTAVDRLPVHPAGRLARPSTRAAPPRPPPTAPTRAPPGPATCWTPGAVRAPRRGRAVERTAGPDLPRLAATGRRRRRAHRGRPRLPPDHAVPAGPAARPPGTAHDRRAARRRRVDRAARGHHRAASTTRRRPATAYRPSEPLRARPDHQARPRNPLWRRGRPRTGWPTRSCATPPLALLRGRRRARCPGWARAGDP